MKRERSDSLNDSHIDHNTIQQWQAKNGNTTNNDNNATIRKGITCNELPCENNFIQLEFYANHVETYHNNRCSKCKQNFVSNHILTLHINECHNPFINEFAKITCFELDCPAEFDSHSERVKHLIAKHNYPPFFDFDVIFSGY
ncbi:hypothetical protein MOSE0_J03840 [Monosporozyma servazzii]